MNRCGVSVATEAVAVEHWMDNDIAEPRVACNEPEAPDRSIRRDRKEG